MELSLIYREFVGFERAFRRQIQAYQQAHPEVAFRLEAHDVPSLYAKMTAQRGALSGQYDLFLAVTDWLPELIRDGLVIPLDDYLRNDPPPDWPEGWTESMRRLQRDAQGRIYGIAYHDGPEVFMYRVDLFNDPKEQERFQRQYGRALAVPRTWSAFLDLARFFTRPAEDLYGCVVAAKPDGHNNVYDFLIHLWSRGGRLLDERLRPAFDSPEGEEALRFYVDLIYEHRVTQPTPWEYDSVGSGLFWASGRAAMMWNWCGFQAVADLPDLSKIPGRTRSTMLPGGDGPQGRPVSLNIYWVMTIPAGSRQRDAAWSFMRHLATPEMDKVTSLEGGTGTRLSTWRDPEVRRRFQYYEVIEEVHRFVESPPPLPEYPAINEVLNQMIAQVVINQRSVAEALREAAEAVESILATAGYYR